MPLDEIVKKNLKFLIGIRHEIEHQMTRRLDDQLSAKFQAAVLNNFNAAIKKHVARRYALDAEQAFSIQFSGISEDSAKDLLAQADLPQHIQTYIVPCATCRLAEASPADPLADERRRREYQSLFADNVALSRRPANLRSQLTRLLRASVGSQTSVWPVNPNPQLRRFLVSLADISTRLREFPHT